MVEEISVKRGSLAWQEIDKEQVVTKSFDVQGDRVEIEYRGGVNAEPYSRLIRTYGPNGIKTEEHWIGAHVREVTKWHYKNDMVSMYLFQDKVNSRETSIIYDVERPLKDEGKQCEETTCKNWSIVYNDDGLPKGWISIDPDTQDMEIWEFRYTFR